MVTQFLIINEHGQLFDDKDSQPITDLETRQILLKNLVLDNSHRLITHIQKQTYYVEAFDFPLQIQKIVFQNGELHLKAQDDVVFKANPQALALDHLDRINGLTDTQIPFVLTTKAQDDLFQNCDEFDDDSFTLNGQKFLTPDYYDVNNTIAQSEHWDSIYKNSETPGWDIKQVCPAFKDMLPRLKWPKSKVIVLGCGEGHDAAFLAQAGHVVTAVDFSSTAIDKAKKQYGHITGLTFECMDVFALPESWTGTFDIVIEHTMYCALPPKNTAQLVKVWKKLLHEEGQIMGVFFTMFKRFGPPFGTNEYSLRDQLAPHFQFLFWGRLRNSVPNRLGKELFVLARKK